MYLHAKQHVLNEGFSDEIDWQDSLDIDLVKESEFLSEAAWVILSSGMSVKVINKVFPGISRSFLNWKSASAIVEDSANCFEESYKIFSNSRKLMAIVKMAEHVNDIGFNELIKMVKTEKIRFIQTLPFMGPATSFHFAKNIGLDVAKPDRHLIRIAQVFGYDCPNSLCSDIAIVTDEKISVIDLVLWRYAVLNRDYISFFQRGH